MVLDLFKALSDEMRLRILRVVSVAELSVAELVGVLGSPQSTVSRHLKPLRDVGLVEARREGTSVYYHRGPAFQDRTLAGLLDGRLEEVTKGSEDAASVRRVLDARRARSREFFDRIAGSYGTLTQPGGGYRALASALAVGFAGQDVADLGAGEGALSLMLARFAHTVTAVDSSPQMLSALREGAERAGVTARVRTAEGSMEALPLSDACMDAVFLSQALHHAAQPPLALAEAARVVKPGGLVIVLDLIRHDQEWVREQWADQWLGFDLDDITAWMTAAGLDPMSGARLSGSTPELSVLLAVGRKDPPAGNTL